MERELNAWRYTWATLFLGLALQVGEVWTLRQQNEVMDPAKLRPKNGCVGEYQQHF
jgi:hypothetical protein